MILITNRGSKLQIMQVQSSLGMGLSTHQFSLGEDFGREQYKQSQHFTVPILFSIPASPSSIFIL